LANFACDSLEGVCDLHGPRFHRLILGVAMHEKHLAWIKLDGSDKAFRQVFRRVGKPPEFRVPAFG